MKKPKSKKKPLLKSGPKKQPKSKPKKSKTGKKLSRAAKQHRAKKPSRGFDKAAKGKTASEAEKEIRDRLESAQAVLEMMDIDSRVRVHRYADGSVDGELLVKVPYGMSSNDVALEMETAVGREGMGGYWINMGTRFTIKEDEEVYRKFRGFNDVNTHYQAAVPANWSEIPLILRKVILKGMEHKYGRKAESVYTRVHWSRHGRKPRSRG